MLARRQHVDRTDSCARHFGSSFQAESLAVHTRECEVDVHELGRSRRLETTEFSCSDSILRLMPSSFRTGTMPVSEADVHKIYARLSLEIQRFSLKKCGESAPFPHCCPSHGKRNATSPCCPSACRREATLPHAIDVAPWIPLRRSLDQPDTELDHLRRLNSAQPLSLYQAPGTYFRPAGYRRPDMVIRTSQT